MHLTHGRAGATLTEKHLHACLQPSMHGVGLPSIIRLVADLLRHFAMPMRDRGTGVRHCATPAELPSSQATADCIQHRVLRALSDRVGMVTLPQRYCSLLDAGAGCCIDEEPTDRLTCSTTS